MRKIRKDGWIAFLEKVNPANSSRLFKVLRKMDGREARVFVYPCAAPLQHEGVLYTNTRAKCELLADHFSRKFNAPATEEMGHGSVERPLPTRMCETTGTQAALAKRQGTKRTRTEGAGRYPPGRRPIKPFEPFRVTEVFRAVDDLASSKAPGPDAIPAEVYKNLPAVSPGRCSPFAPVGRCSAASGCWSRLHSPLFPIRTTKKTTRKKTEKKQKKKQKKNRKKTEKKQKKAP